MPSEKEQIFKDYLRESSEAVTVLEQMGYPFYNQNFLYQVLIYELEEFEIPANVIFHRLNATSMVQVATNYLSSFGKPLDEINIVDSILPENLANDLIKAKIKSMGEIWIIHVNDKDPFPSSPHAHNYSEHYKLHLGNGNLYRKNHIVGSITKKQLMSLREQISKQMKQIVLPEINFN